MGSCRLGAAVFRVASGCGVGCGWSRAIRRRRARGFPGVPLVLAASLGEVDGVTVAADVAVGRRPRPGVRGGALVVVLAA